MAAIAQFRAGEHVLQVGDGFLKRYSGGFVFHYLNNAAETQVDFGIQGNYERTRVGAHGYFSWIEDLITYDLLSPAGGAGGLGGFPSAAGFVNTEEAILAGFEVFGENDLTPWLTSFGTISYIEGRDLSRGKAARSIGSDDGRMTSSI